MRNGNSKATENSPLLVVPNSAGRHVKGKLSSFTSGSAGPGLWRPRTPTTYLLYSTNLEKLYELPTDGLSNYLAVFSMVNCLVGSGILGLPYAFAAGGWLTIALLVFASVGTSYTAKILVRATDIVAKKYRHAKDGVDRTTYASLGRESFGAWFEALINVSMFFELWGGACARILLQGSNLHRLLPVMTTLHWMLLVTAILAPSLFFGMRYLSYMSFLGMTSSILLVLVVFISGAYKGPVHDTVAYRLEGLPVAFGIILFTYSGHAVFPNIYRSMMNKAKYAQMVDIAFLIVLIFYGSLSVVGYLFWGARVESQITLSLPPGVLPKIATVTVVLNTMLSFALLLSVPIEMVETFLGVSEGDDTGDGIYGEDKRSKMIMRGVIRLVLIIGNLGVAIALPSFGLIASLTGALCTMGMSFIFPCMIYLKLNHFDVEATKRNHVTLGLPLMTRLWNYFIIFVGTVGMFTGVGMVMHDAIHKYRH